MQIAISIIIINFKTSKLVLDCIQSVLRFEARINKEIIVVDNASYDDIEEVCEKFKEVRFLQMGYNAGFSKANNAGFKIASGNYVLFLNPDTLFIEPVLQKCINIFDENKDVGSIGCQLLNTDHTLQLSYHDGHKVFRKLWWQNPVGIKFFNTTQYSLHSKKEIEDNHKKSHYADWLCGAFILMKKKDILENQLQWDEDFFMYWEDVELCQRVVKTGKINYYLQEASIVHIGGGGANVPIGRYDMLEKSKLLYIKKNYSHLSMLIYTLMKKMTLVLEKFLTQRKHGEITNIYLKKELEYYKV